MKLNALIEAATKAHHLNVSARLYKGMQIPEYAHQDAGLKMIEALPPLPLPRDFVVGELPALEEADRDA